MSVKSDRIEATILRDLRDGPLRPHEIHARHKGLPVGMVKGFLHKLQHKGKVVKIGEGKWELRG